MSLVDTEKHLQFKTYLVVKLMIQIDALSDRRIPVVPTVPRRASF